MKCPYCRNNSTRVVDTRESSERVRRRRECAECERRFTTYETVEKFDIQVEKNNGKIEDFKEEKLRSGVERAVEKTSVEGKVDEVVEDVKERVLQDQEITSEKIGEYVKEELLERDEVAYIRFASVYDSFENAESFQREVEQLRED